MDKSFDFGWSSSSPHLGPDNATTLKNKSLKTIIVILCIILFFLTICIFVYLNKENSELRFKIVHCETVGILNSNKLTACDFEKNHTTAIKEELLKKIEKLNESEKNEKELSNKLQFEINNIQLQLNKERLDSAIYKNESNYLKKDNEELHSKIVKLEKLNANKTMEFELQLLEKRIQEQCAAIIKAVYHENRSTNWAELQALANNRQHIPTNQQSQENMKTENPDIVSYNRNENDITNLKNENILNDDKKYEENDYADANEAASRSELNPINDDKSSWFSGLGQVINGFTSNADHNNMNNILIVTSTIMIVLLQSLIC